MTHWKRMHFKKNKVWVALSTDGIPDIQAGKALIKYQLHQSHAYRVHADSLYPLDEPEQIEFTGSIATKSSASRLSIPSKVPAAKIDEAVPEDAIVIYVDGACSGNPGPAGIGVLMRYGCHQREISRFIGLATNNIAELKAIRVGLQAVRDRNKPVRVYTDSNYAFGLLTAAGKLKRTRSSWLK